MTDNGGLLGWLAASWHRTMIACGIWEAVCLVFTSVLLGLLFIPRTVAGNPPTWRTQVDYRDGRKHAGVRFYLLSMGGVFCTLPVLTAGIFTGWTIMQWLGVHTWVLPVAVVTATLAAIAVVAWRTRGRWHRTEPAAVTAVPEVEWVTPQPYNMPYGQWSGDEQVIR